MYRDLIVAGYSAGRHEDHETEKQSDNQILKLLKDGNIRLLLMGAFILSFVLNLFLFIYPLSWTALNTPTSEFWIIYLVILVPSGLFVYPYIRHKIGKTVSFPKISQQFWQFLAEFFAKRIKSGKYRYLLVP